MKRITLYVALRTWQAFRVACLCRNISASQAVAELMRAQLTRWAEEAAVLRANGLPDMPLGIREARHDA